MSIIIQPTLWDDTYFNLKTGKLILLDELTPEHTQELKKKSKDFDLVVIDNSKCNLRNDSLLSRFENNYLCDIQVRFKLICDHLEGEKGVHLTLQNNLSYSEELLAISESTYRYSRFKMDEYLDPEKSQGIYKKWCQDAFNKPDKYFVIYKENNRIEGYVLFHIEEGLVIELIAVRQDKQNKGIGSQMINYLISYCGEKHISPIKVGTQANNKEAISFYQRKGFKLQDVHTIYHYWPNKKTTY